MAAMQALVDAVDARPSPGALGRVTDYMSELVGLPLLVHIYGRCTCATQALAAQFPISTWRCPVQANGQVCMLV